MLTERERQLTKNQARLTPSRHDLYRQYQMDLLEYGVEMEQEETRHQGIIGRVKHGNVSPFSFRHFDYFIPTNTVTMLNFGIHLRPADLDLATCSPVLRRTLILMIIMEQASNTALGITVRLGHV